MRLDEGDEDTSAPGLDRSQIKLQVPRPCASFQNETDATLHAFAELIDRCLERDPERRCSSAEGVLGILEGLTNGGYVALALKQGDKPVNLQGVLESLSTKVGVVLLVLGAMHFFNLFVFTKMRRRALLRHFGSPDAVLAASREDLERVPGFPQKVARDLYAHLNKTGR